MSEDRLVDIANCAAVIRRPVLQRAVQLVNKPFRLPNIESWRLTPPLCAAPSVSLLDRKGGSEALKLPAATYGYPRVSPDGKRLAFESNDGKEVSISLYELSGASAARRLTFGGNNRFPLWSADGERVVFQSDRDGDRAVFWQSVDGGATSA